jgi:hypothetical protein
MRRALPFLLGALVSGLVAAVPARATGEPVESTTAFEELQRLAAQLKRHRNYVNEELIATMNAVAAAYGNIRQPEAPAKPEDESDEAAMKAWRDAQREHETQMRRWDENDKKFRKEAISLLLDALVIVQAKNNVTERTEVNRQAARLIGQLLADPGDAEKDSPEAERARKTTSRNLIQIVSRGPLNNPRDHQVNRDLVEDVFATMASLNDTDTLQWMLKSFTHTRDQPEGVLHQLVAAHKAMVLFKNVPGSLRYAVVQEFLKTYPATEGTAKESSTDNKKLAVKRFWDSVKTDTVRVLQYYATAPGADGPPSKEGVALASMAEFQEWFRGHNNVRRPPWVDER